MLAPRARSARLVPMVRPRRILAALLGLIVGAWPIAGALAQGVIRDTEIERFLDSVSRPIFQAAGLAPSDVRVFIINDDKINAFVAGGQNLFLNTGLLVRAETPEQVAGVIAHETGHIAGGHLSRVYLARDQAWYKMIGGAVLGLAAALAGAPEAGIALMAGGLTAAQSGALAFTRVQEQAADQAGVKYLAAEKLPPTGMLEFFEILQNYNMRINREGNVFMRTHPLTRDRITFVEAQIAASPYKGATLGPSYQEAFKRTRVKLEAFLRDPAQTLRLHEGDDLLSRYAQAIAHYRKPDLPKALQVVDTLIREHPRDAYFQELKGQMLFESGRIPESVAPYREAVRLMPDAPLLKFGLARALMEQPQRGQQEAAAGLLREVLAVEPRNGSAWRFLGIAEGRLGRQGPSAMALAEAAILRGDRPDARMFTTRAEQNVKPGDPAWLRLQDLKRTVEQMDDDR